MLKLHCNFNYDEYTVNYMAVNIPSQLSKYFWDSDFTQLIYNERKKYITERLLEYGDIDAFLWLKKNVGDEYILSVLKKSRNISKKTAHFFALLFKNQINEKEIVCLQKDFRDKHKKIWSY